MPRPRSLIKSQRLTIYLLKADFSTPEKALSPKYEPLRFEIPLEGDVKGYLAVGPSTPREPAWISFFGSTLDARELRLWQQSTQGVLFVGVRDRLFALTFGQGRSLLTKGCWDERFGLKVTLNSIDPQSIRSLDKKSFDALTLHTQNQASRAGGAAEFGIDIERDLLCAATGVPRDPLLGTRLSGRDALSTTVHVRVESLPPLLDRYLSAFESKEYQTHFGWVDHTAEVTDPALRDRLDQALVERLRAGGDSDIWLAVPNLLDWIDLQGFRYSDRSNATFYPDLHVRDFLASLRDAAALHLGTLKQRRAFAYRQSTETSIDDWSIYQCLYCEVSEGSLTYLLSDGRWYAIDQTYAASIDTFFKTIPVSTLSLPDYDDPVEEDYNARVSTADATIALMDQRFLTVRGQVGKIELCDLYTQNRQLVHVKRYGGSGTLSHLFAQGATSAGLYVSDSTFREGVNALLPPSHRLVDPLPRIDPRTFEVVFAIISRSRRPLRLPFFSKLGLYRAAQYLGALGYNVSWMTIRNTREAAVRSGEVER